MFRFWYGSGMSAALSSRVDAKRNRERLVTAARELFAAGGIEVSVREIARQADVGVATLYRNFPTREDLVDAVLEDAFDEFVALAADALEESDAWEGFKHFIERALILHAENRALRDVVETQAHGRNRAAAMRVRIRPLLAELVARAQAQGTLRSDFTAQDFPLLLWSGDRVIELAGGVAPNVWRRQLGFVLDGLRAEAAHPLSAPPLTDRQLKRVGVAR
jgi:AcrR family transcriptional regulator